MVTKIRAQLEQEYQRRRETVVFMRDVQHATFGQIGATLAMTRARAWQIYQQGKALTRAEVERLKQERG